jgi:hypothetical protein
MQTILSSEDSAMKEAKKIAEAGNGAPTASELAALVDTNGANIAAFVKASEALWSGMSSMSQEMMQFASTRLRENMDLSGSVLQCGDPREAFRLECDYARNATKQYLDEANKLLAIAADTSHRSWAPIEELTKETLGRIGRR